VRVPAAARIAFGRDQHMLAQGGEEMTAHRTSIRRRLAIGGRPNRPPWRGRKSPHVLIVAPVAATVAAMTVGVVLARAGRDRLEQRRRRLDRKLGLGPREGLAAGIRRMAVGQADLVIELLHAQDGVLETDAVHEMRKALKRLRALVRLLREELGEETFTRENESLRETGRRLSAARDSEVMLATLDRLCQKTGDELAAWPGVATLRGSLQAEQTRMEAITLGDQRLRGRVLGEMLAFRDRALRWRLRERGIALVEPGLLRVYRQGRRRFHTAAGAKKSKRVRTMHEWRKRVKDLRHQAEILSRRDGPSQLEALAGGARRSRRRRERFERDRRRLRRVARRADALAEALGEDHDLALLADLVREAGQPRSARGAGLPAVGKPTQRALLWEIRRRRRRLRRESLRLRAQLYGPRPRRFAARVRGAYGPAPDG
jgi:CHAD domain-containing protein